MKERLRVCHFGGYARDYSRNVVLRKSLELQGVKVIECHSRHPSKVRRYLALIKQYRQVYRQIDVILVGTVGHYYMPLAFVLGKLTHKPVVFDVFDSLYETHTIDLESHSGLISNYYFMADRLACLMAKLVVLDTRYHAEFFSGRLGVPWTKLRWVPVGTDTDLFYPRKAEKNNEQLKVLFVGTFSRLHGVDTIIRAASRLQTNLKIEIALLGRGYTFEMMHGLVQTLGVSNVTFIDPLPYDALPDMLAAADVLLGIFGESPKADLVIPNKVYEALAMAKPLITGDTPIMRELFNDGVNALLCPLGDDAYLAELLTQAFQQPELCKSIGYTGFELFQGHFSLDSIGKEWIQILQEAVA